MVYNITIVKQVVVQQARTERRAADKILLSELCFLDKKVTPRLHFIESIHI